MARNIDPSHAAPTHARFTDAFVIFSVTVVSLALGAWLLLRLGLSLWSGLVLALAIYTVLLSLHLMLRRSWSGAEADDDQPDVTGEHAGAWAAPEPAAPSARRAAAAADVSPPRRSTMPGELIQDLIKKLADELNGAPPVPTDKPAGKPQPANETEALIGRSIEALETTAKAMRTPLAERAPTPPPSREREAAVGPRGWWPAEPQAPPSAAPPPSRQAPPPLNPELARIAEAVAAQRIQMLLEPIHALAEGRARHFEVSMRLLTADGAVLEQADFARTAQGSGLMARIDSERIARAARIARKLAERGRSGSVLASIAGDSLTDAHFVGTASAEPNGRARLVLSFTQDEVRAFSRGHLETLTSLAAAGFGFALDAVTDLDMDFGALKKLGFEFVKLDAPVFLEGLPAPAGHVPAADICRTLADFGLTLVVGKIEDDWLLARILGFGVLFGRGTLFGGPKLVKAEVAGTSAAA
jgi:cyclic-di-GMP phosphodiesterase, flagellum assembly factor TipF